MPNRRLGWPVSQAPSYPDPGTYIRQMGGRWVRERIDRSGASHLIYLTSEPEDGVFESRSSRPQDIDFIAGLHGRRVGVSPPTEDAPMRPLRYLRRIGGRWAIETPVSEISSQLFYLTCKPPHGESEPREMGVLDFDGLSERERRIRIFLSRRRLKHWRRALYRIVN